MRKRSTITIVLVAIMLAAFLAGCATAPKPTEQNMTLPVVTLSYAEVPYYTGWWYFSAKVEPTKGKAGNYGAPLAVAFIFDIENPNPYPVQMEPNLVIEFYSR